MITKGINKAQLTQIENAFKLLQENKESHVAEEMLQQACEDIFPYAFTINVVYANKPTFFMSVYPDESTIQKIITSIAKNDSKAITKLWNSTTDWTIEIDGGLFGNSYIGLNEREFTAMFLHEIGHIVSSNSIPTRITNIMQYEIAKSSITTKALLKDKLIQKIMSLPILNACMVDTGSSLKEELRADELVRRVGYQKELISSITKVKKYMETQNKQSKTDMNADDAMKTVTNFSIDSMNQLKERKAALLESALDRLIQECPSPYMTNELKSLKDIYFGESATGSVTKEKKIQFFYEKADECVEKYITEFFGLGVKSLDRIDAAELDYIAIKMKSIKTDSDKMMLVSYVHNKLDMVDYYLTLLSNPKTARKYRIPYTIDELKALHDRLERYIQDIINMKLPSKNQGLLVAWPEGYEG